MIAELIKIHTRDGLTHYGAFYPPQGKGSALGVVHIHGMTGSFVGEVESAVPPILAAAGYPCLVANNRGTGMMGAATELFRDCIYDIQAAIDELAQRGWENIALVGHSKGGVKVSYYLAQHGDPRVVALGLLSPAPDIHGITGWLMEQLIGIDPIQWLDEARELAQGGQGARLFSSPDWPYLISAATAWEHYSFDGDDVSKLLPGFELPILAFCGELELDWCTPVSNLLKASRPNETVGVIPGADHVYAGREAELAQRMIDWLDGVSLALSKKETSPAS